MTDIPGTILTAIRDAIYAAVLAERERCAKIAEASINAFRGIGLDELNSVREKYGICIAAKIREHATPIAEPFRCPTCGQGQNYAAESTEPGLAELLRQRNGRHFDFSTGLFRSNQKEEWANRFARLAAGVIEESGNGR